MLHVRMAKLPCKDETDLSVQHFEERRVIAVLEIDVGMMFGSSSEWVLSKAAGA